MNSIVKIGIGISIVMLIGSCKNDNDFSDTPELFYRDFQIVDSETAVWSLGFTDGNGDIGVRNESDSSNFFPSGFKIVNGVESPLPPLIPNRIPVVRNVSTRNGIEGEFKFTIQLSTYRNLGFDTIYLSAYVEDRAFNRSNSIQTPIFSINP